MKLRPRAPISWTAEGVPYAEEFGDIYYSKHGGLDETHAVFLEPLGLPALWQDRRQCALAELGFGAGLNALATWDLWARTRDSGAILHFISVEGFPMDRADAARALTAFPEIGARAQTLLARWPSRTSGVHRLWFPEDGFCLTLIHEEAADALALINGPIDGWLLDGFAPARNPDMWSPALLTQIARISAPGARAATYSIASAVRSALTEAGFAVERAPGFAKKRERLIATAPGAAPARISKQPHKAVIIGGGIAAACSAAALKQRGVSVTIVEGERIAAGASGNPVGLVSPRLDSGEDPAAQFMRAAYLYAVDLYRTRAPGAFQTCGVTRAERDPAKAARLAADPPLPEDWLQTGDATNSGLTAAGAFLLPQAGLLDPKKAIEALMQDCEILEGRAANAILRSGDIWRVLDDHGGLIADADMVVIAAGAGAAQLLPSDELPLQGRRGAISIAATQRQGLHAISGGAYALPWHGDLHFGATFDPAPLNEAPAPLSVKDHIRNQAELQALSPQHVEALGPMDTWRGRASMRVATPDHLPIAGALPDWEALTPILEQLARGALDRRAADPPRQEGLFVIAALGARGLTTAPLLGEFIAALAFDDPALLPPKQVRALDPVRFALRAAQRHA